MLQAMIVAATLGSGIPPGIWITKTGAAIAIGVGDLPGSRKTGDVVDGSLLVTDQNGRTWAKTVIGGVYLPPGSDDWRALKGKTDANGDGWINGDDFDLFSVLFQYGSEIADFTRDGFTNGDDWDMFSAKFQLGEP